MKVQTELFLTPKCFLAESQVGEEGPEAVVHIMPNPRKVILEIAFIGNLILKIPLAKVVREGFGHVLDVSVQLRGDA